MAHNKSDNTSNQKREQEQDGTLPPPETHRPDTMVRGVSPNARKEMENAENTDLHNQASFTKGKNAPTVDRTGLPYTVEQMDEMFTQAPKPLFPDSPGGGGAAPLSADRDAFLDDMVACGHFGSRQEAARWAKAVFDALRLRLIEVDSARATVFDSVVRVGEAPEVQVEEMMWGQGYVDRFSLLVSNLRDWNKSDFYRQVANYGRVQPDDPWVEVAVHSFFSALKRRIGDAACDVGELRELWQSA
jgi:uncharacterized protein (DUF2267 family)